MPHDHFRPLSAQSEFRKRFIVCFMEKKLKKLLPIYLVVFLGFIGYSLIITIFTPMILRSENGLVASEYSQKVRILALGLLIFVYPFGQFLSSSVLGAFSDRYGRRPLLLFSISASTILYALIGVSVILQNFWLVALFLFIAGLSEGNITIAQSVIADLTEIHERSRYFGYMFLSIALSYIVGPLLGGMLADGSPDKYSYASSFFVVSALLCALLFWLQSQFQESLAVQNRREISYFEAFTNFKNLFLLKHVRHIFSVNAVLYFAIFGFFQSFPIYIVTHFDVGVWTLCFFIAWSSIPFLIVNLWLTDFLAKRFSSIKIAFFSALWVGIFIEILLIPNHIGALWVSLFIVGLGCAVCLPATISLLSATAKKFEQGSVMGINQSLQFFAEGISGLIVGLLAAIFVKLSLFIFGLLSLFGALLIFLNKKDFSLR